MSKHADDNSSIDWDNFALAWKALGLEPSAFPAARVERVEHFAEPPLPPEPELEPPSLSDDEWAVLGALMPAKNKYLSRLAPRDFITAGLFWVWCGRKFALVPTPSIERFRAKLYRSFVAGLFTALAQESSRVHGALTAQTAGLLTELASAERVYVKRNDEFKAARLKKLAREKVASKSRGA